jgi:DnaJ domain
VEVSMPIEEKISNDPDFVRLYQKDRPETFKEIATFIYENRGNINYKNTGVSFLDALLKEYPEILYDIASRNVEAAKIFLGSAFISSKISYIDQAKIIHEHRKNDNFLNELQSLLEKTRSSLSKIAAKDVEAANTILGSASLIRKLQPLEIAVVILVHISNENFSDGLMNKLFRAKMPILDIVRASSLAGRLFLLSEKFIEFLNNDKNKIYGDLYSQIKNIIDQKQKKPENFEKREQGNKHKQGHKNKDEKEIEEFIDRYGESPYEALYISFHAGQENETQKINHGYRESARKEHPDHNANNKEKATEAMQKINAAYAILKDRGKRAIVKRLKEDGLVPAKPLEPPQKLNESRMLQDVSENGCKENPEVLKPGDDHVAQDRVPATTNVEPEKKEEKDDTSVVNVKPNGTANERKIKAIIDLIQNKKKIYDAKNKWRPGFWVNDQRNRAWDSLAEDKLRALSIAEIKIKINEAIEKTNASHRDNSFFARCGLTKSRTASLLNEVLEELERGVSGKRQPF